MPSKSGHFVEMQLQLKMDPEGTLQGIQLSIRDDSGYIHIPVQDENYAMDHENRIHAISFYLPKNYTGIELKVSDDDS